MKVTCLTVKAPDQEAGWLLKRGWREKRNEEKMFDRLGEEESQAITSCDSYSL